MTNCYYKNVIDYFGSSWFDSAWKEFREIRNKFSNDSFSSEITKLELSLHPLHRDIFTWQDLSKGYLDFDKIPQKSASDFNLSHLGRDLELLSEEIKQRGSHIKHDLLDPVAYENHRFTLLVAAGYKKLGFTVEFVPASSSKGKTPDLLVNDTYFIECKQRNQQSSDDSRYRFFGELVETYFGILRVKGINNYFLNIEDNGSVESHKNIIDTIIRRKIFRNQTIPNTKNTRVSLTRATDFPDLIKILKEFGHFLKAPVFTRTEDAFIASDPKLMNLFMLNKNINVAELSKSVFSLLTDADSKDKKNKKLIVYIDLGRAPSEWIANLADYLYKGVGVHAYKNIDAFVVCRTPILYTESRTEIRPNFNIIGHTSRLGDTPDKLNLFGFQGHTGMDGYFIDGFLNPIITTTSGSKYIECHNCGFRLEGIATNLGNGEQLSEANMPCPKCSHAMDMTIKET